MQVHPDSAKPLSEVLLEICEYDQPTITVAEMTARFGGRALGALLLIFSLICLIPWPPGGTTIFGMPLLLLSPQLVIGKHQPWLPSAIQNRTFAVADLSNGLRKVVPWLRRIEAVSKPRLPLLFGKVGEACIGIACTLLAFVLILPIWGGNFLPAVAVLMFSVALLQRDGALAILGYLLVAASVSVLVLAANIIVIMLQYGWVFFTDAWARLVETLSTFTGA